MAKIKIDKKCTNKTEQQAIKDVRRSLFYLTNEVGYGSDEMRKVFEKFMKDYIKFEMDMLRNSPKVNKELLEYELLYFKSKSK